MISCSLDIQMIIREISITKFERDVHVDGGYVTATPNMITYRLIDAYPISVDNIRLG